MSSSSSLVPVRPDAATGIIAPPAPRMATNNVVPQLTNAP